MTTKTDLLATRVEGIRPAIPAANSTDANTNALHTDIAAAEDMIDTHAAPPPAKAADPDGWDYFADSIIAGLWRYRPGDDAGEILKPGEKWSSSIVKRYEWRGERSSIGPASRAACEAFLRGEKPNPDDHGDNGQSERTRAATVARVHGLYYHAVTEPIVVSTGEHPAPDEPIPAIPTCAACGSPKPTAFTAENDAHLRRELRNRTETLQHIADDLRIEGPFPDCAERDLLVATARAVIRHATGGVS